MSGLTYVNIDELRVGDIVGYCRYVSFSWHRNFRYPIVLRRVIKRITPKRTKFVLDDGIELDVGEAKRLVVINDEASRQSSIARVFSDLQSIEYKIAEAKRHSNYVIEDKLTDEELVEYHKVMKNIYDKYLEED